MSQVTHFIRLADLGPDGVAEVLETARRWKREPPGPHLAGKLLGMLFFNPSLRTRASFEAAMLRGGGHAIVLEVGAGTWKLETREGVVMNGDRPEHVREAIPVLCRYVDALAVRVFSEGAGDAVDHEEPVLEQFRSLATKPLISMEGAREHPCQGLADLLTLKERFGEVRGLPLTLTWAPHIKPLPKAVPNSFLLTAAACGCDVRIAHPPGYELHEGVLTEARWLAERTGARITVTHDAMEARAGSACLYAKAWGPAEGTSFTPEAHREWMPTMEHFDAMREDAVAMHCLPVRRNLEVSEEVLESPRCLVTDEAENRFHVQRVILDRLLGGNI